MRPFDPGDCETVRHVLQSELDEARGELMRVRTKYIEVLQDLKAEKEAHVVTMQELADALRQSKAT